MIEFIAAGIVFISPSELPYKEEGLDSHICYINNQLVQGDGYKQMVFNAYIPEKYHSQIIDRAFKDGWSVTVEQTRGFYSWQECYRFTFTPLLSPR